METKKDFCLNRISELIDAVIARESIPSNSESVADLGYVKFYARELANQCTDCESKNETVD